MPTPGAAVDLMVEARFKGTVISRLNAMPTILLIDDLIKSIAQIATSLKTRMWEGLNGCLALILEASEMRLFANDPTLDCNKMEKPPFTHPDTTPMTTVTKEKNLTNEHKVTWDEYHLQEVIIFNRRAATVAAVMPQYIEEKEVDYLGYSIESILSLIAHFRTWTVIKNAKGCQRRQPSLPSGETPPTNISAPTHETSQGGKTTPRSITSRSLTTIK